MLTQRALALAGTIAALAWASPSVKAQEPTPPGYRETIDDAVKEFADSHWEEARALFKRAHELSPNARTLRGLGMADYELRLYVQAMRELDAALKDTRKPLEGTMRSQVQALMDKASKFVGRLRLQPEPPDAKLLIDGKELVAESDGSVLLDVGTHTVSATAERFKPTNLRVNVEGGSEQSVEVQLEPLLTQQSTVPAIEPNAPPPSPAETAKAAPVSNDTPSPKRSGLKTFAWVAVAGAASFGIASGVFWAIGSGQYSDAQKQCRTTCSDQQISSVKTSDTLTTVFLGLGVASAATAVLLFAIGGGASSEKDGEAQATAQGLSLGVAPTGVSLEGRF